MTRRVVPGPRPERPDLEPAVVGGVLVHGVPLDQPTGATELRRVTYGTAGAGGRDLHLWVHGRADTGERRPGVVFVHGGAWAGGSPSFHLRHCHELAQRGWVAATIGYRLSVEARWPAAIEDVRCAVRWLRAHADELGLDPDRIAIAGGSAGGQLAGVAALAPSGVLEGEGGWADTSSAVQAAVLWAPITDMAMPHGPDLTELIASFLGPLDDAVLAASSPVTHVAPGSPPVLTMLGTEDVLVSEAMITDFHDALDAAGVANELVVYEGRDHGFELIPPDWEASFEELAAFLERHLG